MSNKLTIPSVVGLDTKDMPFGNIVFLQAVEDALKTVDNNVVYKDAVQVVVPQPRIQAKSAQGQAFSVSGVNVASGDDYAVLVSDFQALLTSHIELSRTVNSLVRQLQGA